MRADAVSAYATMTEDVRAKLDELGARLAPSARRVTAHVCIGHPDAEIAQLASDLNAGLVVVGAHGHKGFIRSILGSVAQSLVRNAPCPVLTCRSQATPLWEQIEAPCIDCSPYSVKAIERDCGASDTRNTTLAPIPTTRFAAGSVWERRLSARRNSGGKPDGPGPARLPGSSVDPIRRPGIGRRLPLWSWSG